MVQQTSSKGKELPQSPEIHTHDLNPRNHIPGYHIVQRQQIQTQTYWISKYAANQLRHTSISIEHLTTPIQYSKNPQKESCISRIRTKLNPDSLEASLDKFDLIERVYKLEEIKRGFLEALQFECKELIAERPKNKQTPLVYITRYNPHLRNLRKTLTKGWDRIKKQRLEATVPKN